jgi:hypothetical protein
VIGKLPSSTNEFPSSTPPPNSSSVSLKINHLLHFLLLFTSIILISIFVIIQFRWYSSRY